MELINREWLLAEITRHFEIMVKGDDIEDVVCAIRGNDLKNVIDKAPTFKDLEPVVRCKDCRYNYANMIPNGKGCQRNVYIEVDDNFFCADGEREDEVGE